MLEETKLSVLSKTKGHEEIAESLDNTAPFKKIVAAIDQKKKKKKTLINYLSYTVRRRNTPGFEFSLSDFLYPAQPRNKFNDDWDGELNSGFFEDVPYKSLTPFMITKVQHIGKIDPITELLHQVHKWTKKWHLFRIAYTKSKKNSIKWFGDDVLYCPKMCIEMAEHLVNKPDPYFDNTYNWYYAGKGNLLTMKFDGLDYLIHNISPFSIDSLSIDMHNTIFFKCDEDTNILETIYSQLENIVAIRTKCKVVILKIHSSNGNISLEHLKELDSELPFTSITFDEYHNNIMYATTLDNQLIIINLDRMTKYTKKLRGKFKTLTDNWSCVIGGERGYYTHVTNKAITLYDKRTNEPFQRYKAFGLISDIQTCGKVSAVKYSARKPLLYVGTDHHIFLMDMRCGKSKDENIKPIQRWSHGMMVTPTYIDISQVGHTSNKEIVCMASQWFEDMCIVNNYSDHLTRTGEIRGLSMPYRPPSIMQTFNEAQRQRLCGSLYETTRHRICTAISGLSIMEQGDNYVVLQQNSLGDISCHTLYSQHMINFIGDDSTERLDEWSKGFKEKIEPFEVSHIVEISKLLDSLCLVPDDFILGRNSVIESVVKFNENEIYNTYSKEKLDPELLEIWKDENEEIELDKTGMSQFLVDNE